MFDIVNITKPAFISLHNSLTGEKNDICVISHYVKDGQVFIKYIIIEKISSGVWEIGLKDYHKFVKIENFEKINMFKKQLLVCIDFYVSLMEKVDGL